jgi:DNA replication licensing factor MCM5
MLEVDIAHLISFNEELAHKLANEPSEILPIVRPCLHHLLPLR